MLIKLNVAPVQAKEMGLFWDVKAVSATISSSLGKDSEGYDQHVATIKVSDTSLASVIVAEVDGQWVIDEIV